jgi:membrane associated rhomboid family serine protease
MILPLHDDNPTRLRPVVTVSLIVACVAVFVLQVVIGPAGNERLFYGLGMVPAVLLGHEQLSAEVAMVPPVVTVFTSMFLHGGVWHLFSNMLFLWIFGNNVEDAMGHGRFVAFYLLCGVAAVFAQALPEPTSTLPMVGASGAISGVLGAYMLLYPHARVLLGLPLGFLVLQLGRFRAIWVLAAWFLLQLVMDLFAARGPDGEGGVAFRAHIGGFIAGMALIAFFKHPDVRFFQGGRPTRR